MTETTTAVSIKEKMKGLPDEQKQKIKGWYVYDWANSAFSTSITVAILPIYAMALINTFLKNNPDSFFGNFSASGMWAFVVGFSTLLVALSSPLLGIIADRMEIKMKLLKVYTIVGAGATVMMFFSAFFGGYDWLFLLLCFFIANTGFAGANVFYNALLPYMGDEELMDDISSRGFAYGYIGGGLLLAVHLGLLMATDNSDLMIRLSLASVGIWWWGFSVYTFRHVPEPVIKDAITGMRAAALTKMAFKELKKTFRELTKFKMLVIYLLAFLMFNDGIQTVLAIAGAFGGDVLGVSMITNMVVILMIQFVAAPSAMAFSRLAEKTTTKKALIVSLVGWCLIISMATGFCALEPDVEEDFIYRANWVESGQTYAISVMDDHELDLEDDGVHRKWDSSWGLANGVNMNASEILLLSTAIEDTEFTLFIDDGPASDGVGPKRVYGKEHPSQIGEGTMDSWPETLRENVWKPLSLGIDGQWLFLGLGVGIVMGGSQALARSIFGMMVPETRATEFFGFFGFIGKAASVIGPWVYFLVSTTMDDRVAVFSIVLLILVGTAMMYWVDVEEGTRVAKQEDAIKRGGAEEA